jgi:hypothetical protein
MSLMNEMLHDLERQDERKQKDQNALRASREKQKEALQKFASRKKSRSGFMCFSAFAGFALWIWYAPAQVESTVITLLNGTKKVYTTLNAIETLEVTPNHLAQKAPLQTVNMPDMASVQRFS